MGMQYLLKIDRSLLKDEVEEIKFGFVLKCRPFPTEEG
jgi:hypothetical protein